MEAGALDNMGYVYTQLGRFSVAKACYDRALNVFREIDSQQGITSALPFAAWLLHMLGDAPAAQAQAAQALELADELDDPYARNTALTVLGHALADLGRPEEAAENYHQAVQNWRQSSQFNQASDPLSGLARLALQRGDLESAGQIIEEILDYLSAHSLDGALDPCWTHLTCLQVLQARRDPRAAELLNRVHEQIMGQAACISDPELRRSFLEKVPARRRILEMHRDDTPAAERPTSRRLG
jgi:tetratricopeptide (TPR) repeat protein